MRTLITIYLTALHLFAITSFWFYTNEVYRIVKVDSQSPNCQNEDLTACLEKAAHKHNK